jgi:hypothetical protein
MKLAPTTWYSTEKSSRVLGTKKSAKLTTYGQPFFSRFHSARISVSLVMEGSDEIVFVPVLYVPAKHLGLVRFMIGHSR